MNPTIQLIFTIAGAALTLLTVYGVLKLDRKLFLSGICYFSLLPIIGESMAYNADKDKGVAHIVVILVFIAQFILALPNKNVYGPDNSAAVKLATKIALAILVFNIGGIIYIFCFNTGVPVQFGYYHLVIALAVLYLIIKRVSSKGATWVK
jgi:hypothetical protein